MEYKHYTVQRFHVDISDVYEFNDVDPFNDNTLKGCIALARGPRYGSIIIFEVNGRIVTPQEIITTPKIHYPFIKNQDGSKKYIIPDYDFFDVRPKVDGTNIFAYKYNDASGKSFITFKNRLSSVLKATNYSFMGEVFQIPETGAIIKRMLNEFVRNRHFGLSFELFGFTNHHLIRYQKPIDIRLLFGIDQRNGNIIPPDMFTNGDQDKLIVPCHLFYNTTEWNTNLNQESKKELFIKIYEDAQIYTEKGNKLLEDKSIIGNEGFIFYLYSQNKYILYKCEPPSIEALHYDNF
jgi:hypothetical protein